MIGRCGMLAIAWAFAFAGNAPAYLLGPGDQITIQALDAEEISGKPFTVDASGLVNLPLVGRVQASGLTVPEFEAALTTRLREYVVNPRPTVSVTEYHSQPVSVIGAVNTPGVQQLRGRKTLIEVLSLAGGLRPDAGSRITIQREAAQGSIPLLNVGTDPSRQFSIAEVNVQDLMESAHPSQNVVIRPNDIVSVSRADIVYVLGEVKKAGGFPMNDRRNISVLQALSLAEGVAQDAAPGRARILRGGGTGAEREEIPVNLKHILSGKTPDLPLQADDILFIPGSAEKKAAVRGLEAAIQLGTGVIIWRH